MELSRAARVRLAWMDFYRVNQNVALTCRHFGISRQTFYRWQRRYDPYDLTTLEARSHRPHRQRQPTWSFLLEEKVLTLRLQFPRWGKDKLAILLRHQQLPVSPSMVGRILTHLQLFVCCTDLASLNHSQQPCLVRDYRISRVRICIRDCDSAIRVLNRLIVHALLCKAVRGGGQIEDFAADIAGFRRTDQCFGNIPLRARKVPVMKVCKTQLPLRAVFPLCIAESSCQGHHLRPIATHRGRVAFPIEIAFNDETEHPQFLIRLQERICGEFLIQHV